MITTGSNGPTREAGPALLHRYLLRLESVRTDIANSMTVARGLDELAHLCARKASVAFDLLQQAPLDTHEVQAGSAAKTADLGSQIHDCCQYGVEAADARWQIMDLAYAEVDTSIKDLDRRMRLLDSLLKQQGTSKRSALRGRRRSREGSLCRTRSPPPNSAIVRSHGGTF